MNTLGKYCHNFPKLAEDSGYCFELHRGRVDWAQIERLNINDIVNNRNFQLLEQNLINVINCNLEREYDTKILDQNFVKLFQLAQLGVDYLSYCELYLDRCVVLLQEQLASYEEDLESLRKENQKKSNQLKESRQKIKAEAFYQCKKCEKVFLTEIYLKSHEKRRHNSNQESFKVPEPPKPELVTVSQQTDEEKKMFTTSTQTTVFESENITSTIATITKENEEILFLKKEQELKIKNLENELDALKERLKNTEKKLNGKNESAETSQLPHQFPFSPNPMFYPQVIPYIPPYVSQPQCFNPDFLQQNNLQNLKKTESTKPTVEKQLQVDEETCPQIISKGSPEKKDALKRKEILIKKPIRPKILKSKKRLQFDKENVDPALESSDEDIKPIPFPRKSKEIFEPVDRVDSLTNVTPFDEEETAVKVTPVKTFEKEQEISSDSTKKGKKSKSFLKKMMPKNPPKIQELSRNFKRSLTNFYDSVSPIGKDSPKAKEEEDSDKEVKTDVVDGLNSRLKELGIDPEWSGIPKQTMKQKLKTLEHRRNLLSKENPMYPSIRKRLEKTIFKKISKSSNLSEVRQAASLESLYENSSKSPVSSSISPLIKESQTTPKNKNEKEQETEPESIKNQTPTMYDLDFDSQSDISNAEGPAVNLNKEYNKFSSSQNFPEKIEHNVEEINVEKVKPLVKEMDFSIFQIGKNNKKSKFETEKLPKTTVLNTVDELQTDSDFDDDFLKEFEESSFKSINGFLNSTENDKKTKDDQSNEKIESQSILKSSHPNQKAQPNVKKKVFFADHPITDSQSSSAILNEMKQKPNVKQNSKNIDWSSESDWDQ